MTDIEKGRINRPRDEGIFVSRVESEKKEKTPFVQLKATEGNTRMLIATFLNTLKRVVNALSSSDEEGKGFSSKIVEQQTILETLLIFKNLLITLSKEDNSQNAAFAQELSDLWIKLHEDFERLHASERKGSFKIASFRRFLDQIDHYPQKVEHSLGYYLIEQAGRDWLPFPFIEILQGLHADYQLKGDTSALGQWIHSIDELSRELRGKIPQ